MDVFCWGVISIAGRVWFNEAKWILRQMNAAVSAKGAQQGSILMSFCPICLPTMNVLLLSSFPPFYSQCMLLLCWWITRGRFGSVAMVISMLPQRLLPLSIATFMALTCALQYYWKNFLVTNYSSCYKYSTLFQSLFDLASAEAAWNISASLQLYL